MAMKNEIGRTIVIRVACNITQANFLEIRRLMAFEDLESVILHLSIDDSLIAACFPIAEGRKRPTTRRQVTLSVATACPR
jgi:hypothetical protein